MVLIIGDGLSDRFVRLAESFVAEVGAEAARQGIQGDDRRDIANQLALAALAHSFGKPPYAGSPLARQVALFLDVQPDANAALDLFVRRAWDYFNLIKSEARDG